MRAKWRNDPAYRKSSNANRKRLALAAPVEKEEARERERRARDGWTDYRRSVHRRFQDRNGKFPLGAIVRTRLANFDGWGEDAPPQIVPRKPAVSGPYIYGTVEAKTRHRYTVRFATFVGEIPPHRLEPADAATMREDLRRARDLVQTLANIGRTGAAA